MNPRPSFPLFLLLALLATLSPASTGLLAQNAERQYQSHELRPDGLHIQVSDGTLRLRPYTADNLEVLFTPNGMEAARQAPSYAIGSEPLPMETSVEDTPDSLKYTTPGLSVTIAKRPFQMRFNYAGRVLFSESRGYCDFGEMKGFQFQITPEELLYGGGCRVLGMNRRSHKLQLYNQASYGYETEAALMYYSMPVVISSRKYMITYDNAASGWLNMAERSPDFLEFVSKGGRMAYLVTAANTWPELIEHYTALTGRQPMVPRWSWGNIASRMGYRSQQQVLDVIQQYLDDGIPLDAIVLDLYWFGPDLKGHMGNLDWDYAHFPKPEKMMEKARQRGVKTVLITEPFILTQSKRWAEAVQADVLGKNAAGEPYTFEFYFGETGLIDIFKPEAREWFWNIYANLTRSGVDGWWGDLGEPEVHPDDLLHVNGRADELHNAYGHVWARTVFDGYERDFPSKRPVILMRSGFAGSQRYGMVPWTGDVNRTWGGLTPQVEISLQMGMQGLAWMHSDLGGFAGDYLDPELYTRWLQYGVFQPMYRTHAQEDVPPEPVFWDEDTKNIVREFIKLRYRLLPYHYTLMYENTTTGMPFMRPLFYIDDDPELLTYDDAYLWGDAFLVSPVKRQGATQQDIRLPREHNWFDFWTGRRHEGGREISVDLKLEEIPVFLRGGAFVPMIDPIQHTGLYSSKKLTLLYQRDPDVLESYGKMYEDDGHTRNALGQGHYELLNFKAEESTRMYALRLTLSRGHNGEYDGKPEQRHMHLHIRNQKREPSKVKIGEELVKLKRSPLDDDSKVNKTTAWYDGASNELHILFPWDGEALQVVVQ